MAGRPGVFQCKRCSFAAPVSVKLGVDEQRTEKDAALSAAGHLDLFACPLCGRRRSYLRLVLHCLVWAVVLLVPATIAAILLVLVVGGALELLGDDVLAFSGVVGLVAVVLAAATMRRWKKVIAATDAVKLRRYWEWQLPSGPRVVAVQDPASGTDAVWLDGVRAAPSEDEYVIPLQDAQEGPYRAQSLHATLRFPADGTCWLLLGGKRIEPGSTSSDVV